MKQFLRTCLLALVVALLHTALFSSSWGDALEMRFLDLWFQTRGPVTPPEDVAIVAMDEDSYGVLGFSDSQAWPRATHANLLRRLKEDGARKVVFDVLFYGGGPSPAVDDALASAMREVPTVIGADIGDSEDAHHVASGVLVENKSLLLPLDKFRNVTSVGLVGVHADGEHVRRFLLPATLDTHEVTGDLPSLAGAATGITSGPGRRDFIRFYGPAQTIPTWHYYQAIETEKPLPANTFRDKIVFVGLSLRTELGPAQKDSYLTSYPIPDARHGRTFGVEIHATAAANLLHHDWIRRSSTMQEVWLLALVAMLISLAMLNVRPVPGALIMLGYGALWGGVAYYSFLHNSFVPGATLAVIVMPTTYLGATLFNYLVAHVQQLRLQRAFKFYLSPEMSREIARNPKALRLGGEEVECTALFTDIANFTNTAEQMKPEKVAEMLNAYFTEVMDSIFEQRGTLIKFIGDAVFALWGAPIKTKEHARLCCEAALAIHREIERFNQSGRFPPLQTRFGINTGPMVVGNMGSARRFDFTAIGDAVNLASRVEGLNKYFGTTILVTDSTRAQLPAEVHSLKLGLIRVVGKTQPVGLHTLFQKPVSDPTAAQWRNACATFIKREWQAADELFAGIVPAEPRLAEAAELYRHQIEMHRLNAPSADWQGEIIFSSK